MKERRPFSYTVRASLASGVLFYAVRLGASGRNPIDLVVLGLVSAAILWNLVRLGRRLGAADGARGVWHLQRTVLFWVIGLMNTALRAGLDVSWRNVVGWALLVVAAADTVGLHLRERKILEASRGGEARG